MLTTESSLINDSFFESSIKDAQLKRVVIIINVVLFMTTQIGKSRAKGTAQ